METRSEKIARERAANRAAMQSAAAQICAALVTETGQNWQVEPQENNNDWYNEDHARLMAGEFVIVLHRYRTGSKSRLSVFGIYPRGPEGEQIIGHTDNEPQITANFDRPAAAIAKDITRRFWPAYQTLHATAKRRAVARAANITTLAHHAADLAHILEGQIYNANGKDRPIVYTANATPGRGKFEVLTPDTVLIDISTDPLTARRIAMILADI